MNNRQNNRRRGRNNRPQGGGGRGADPQNRIDNRTRGNALQLHEKYRNMARDAQTTGDRVQAEYWWQFADHYYRVVADQRARQEERQGGQSGRSQRDEWRGRAEDDDDRQVTGSDGDRDDRDDYADDWRSARGRGSGRDGDGRQERSDGREEPDEVEQATAPESSGRRQRRSEPPAEEGAAEAVPKPRRGRPRKANGSGEEEARMDGDALPPAISSENEAPRRRGRPRKPKGESAAA